MRTVAIAKLKATLSAELKRVQAGETVTVLDRRTPVALLVPIPEALALTRESAAPYEYRELLPITDRDPLDYLQLERDESW